MSDARQQEVGLGGLSAKSESGSGDSALVGGQQGAPKERHILRRLVMVVALVAALFLAWIVGAAVVPRWWAQRVSGLIEGRIVFGNLLGLGSGFLFMVLPLLVLRMGWKFSKSWKNWKGLLATIVAAAIVAAPNLLTLGIVLGTSKAAHAAERTMDVDGVGFRGGSLVGAVLGLLVFVGTALLLNSRRRNKRRVAALKAELANR